MLATTVKAPADSAVERRAARYAARHVLWDESRLSRIRSCGRSVQSNSLGVAVKVSTSPDGTRSAGYAGLQHCGSVWGCPVCSATIASRRQHEIAAALSAWCGTGNDGTGVLGRVALATFTMRHRRGQRLKTLWDALASSWHKVVSGRGWRTDQSLYGIAVGPFAGRIPVIRVVEVTHGADNGWHVHIHALLLLGPDATDETAAALESRMFGRWNDALVARGMSAPLRSVGTDVRLLKGDPAAALGEYFTKSIYRASMETARGDLKTAKGGNRAPFSILSDVVEHGDADDLALWHEWERASKGRRQIAWTRGLKAQLLPEVEDLTDEELCDVDAGGEVETNIDRSLWRVVQAQRADWAVLRAFEESKRAGLALLMSISPDADADDEKRWEAAKASAPPPGRRY